jgi:uridine kinase
MLAVETVRYDALTASLLRLPGEVKFVAIDGCAGAGKSTFAGRLAAVAEVPIVRTDHFASWDEPMDWWPRLLHEVIQPLAAGTPATYRRSVWDPAKPPTGVVRVEPAPMILIEGVSAGRREFRDHLAYVIWVDAPHDLRLRRGLARDEWDAKEKWERWMATEEDYVVRDDPVGHADLVVDGAAVATTDREFVVLSR